MKRPVVSAIQKYVSNPPVRALFWLRLVPPGYALLETRGRKSLKLRRTPVGNGLEGDKFWIVAEHGRHAGYVRNIEADPRVRVGIGQHLSLRWYDGTAHVLYDDDPRARQRQLARGKPGRRLNAVAVRTLGTDLVTVRVDLHTRA